MLPTLTKDNPVNDDYFTAEVSPAVNKQTQEKAIIIELSNRGQLMEWCFSRHSCLEYAEAEAEQLWPNLKEINGHRVLQER